MADESDTTPDRQRNIIWYNLPYNRYVETKAGKCIIYALNFILRPVLTPQYDFYEYSRTSRKRPPKMLGLGGRFREVVAYESLDHIGPKDFFISMV